MRIFFIYFFALLTFLCLLLSGGCRQQEQKPLPEATACQSKMVLHTVVTLRAEGGAAETAVAEAMARLEELERLTDPNRPESEIAGLNAAAGQGAVKISPVVFSLLEQAQRLAELTEGAFDVTLLPVSRLYGFGTAQPGVPTDEQLQAALRQTGWRKLRLDPAAQTAELTEAGMAVDLGAAVKGLAADEVRRIFQGHGVKRGLCSFGRSTVLAWGSKENGEGWQVGLRHPRREQELAGAVTLQNQFMSVSGDYERYFEQDGVRYHHLLNPADGRPARALQGVAVILPADTPQAGLWSDMLSTAFFVLGKEKTERLVQSLSVKVQYVIFDGINAPAP